MSAISEVTIGNLALHRLGVTTQITSLDDNNIRARTIKLAYDPIRQAELRAHRWSFAIGRTHIAADAAQPDSDYYFSYQVPNDFIRLIEGGDVYSDVDMSDFRGPASATYSLEGKSILTNIESPLYIRYMRDIVDPTLFDPCFVQVLAVALAIQCCAPITESSAKVAELETQYKKEINKAIRANALERAPQVPADDSWILARAG